MLGDWQDGPALVTGERRKVVECEAGLEGAFMMHSSIRKPPKPPSQQGIPMGPVEGVILGSGCWTLQWHSRDSVLTIPPSPDIALVLFWSLGAAGL